MSITPPAAPAPAVPRPDEFTCPYCFDQGAAPAVREPLTDEQLSDLVMEHLGAHALTGGKMSVYDAFLLAVRATERAHGIGGGGRTDADYPEAHDPRFSL